MIRAGDRVPPARVWRAPLEQVDLRELAREGPYLLFFYVLDWTHV